MADPVGVRVEGLDGLRSVLRSVADKDIQNQLKSTNKEAAQIVVTNADVPVRTGNLKASVRALGSQASGRAVAGSARAPGAATVHWGRKRGNVGRPPGNHPGANPVAANPFLADAAQKHRDEIEARYAADIDRVMDAVRRFTA